MFRFKRPFFHFGSGCLLTDEAARLMLGSGTIWNVSGMHAVGRVLVQTESEGARLSSPNLTSSIWRGTHSVTACHQHACFIQTIVVVRCLIEWLIISTCSVLSFV